MIHVTVRLRVLLLLCAGILAFVGGALRPGPVRADDYNISSSGNTAAPALGISPDGDRICAVWTRFDVDPQAFIRVYSISGQRWSPDVNGAPFQLSSGSFSRVQSARCAIDARGAVHAIWEQGAGRLDIVYRFLRAGGDAANGNDWSGPATLEEGADGSDIDAVYADANGKVWVVNRKFNASGKFDLQVRSGTLSNGNAPVAWSGVETIPNAGNGGSARVAADNNGFVHVTYQYGGSEGIRYVHRDPNGRWTGPVQVPGSGNSGQHSLTVNRTTGEAHVAYAKNFKELFYTKTSGSAATDFAPVRGIAAANEPVQTPTYLTPRITWALNGRLLIAVDDSKTTLEIITSDDNGATWRGPDILAAPGGGVEAPWVVGDRTGTGYVLYAHRSGSTIYFLTAGGGGAPSPPPAPVPVPPAVNPATRVPAIADGAHDYFDQTGHNLGGAFREYWHSQGGLTRFGYPLTEEFTEQSEDDGQTYLVQYFERARFEWHPANLSPYNVLLGRLGLRLRPLDLPAAAIPGLAYAEPTGHNLGGAFLAYWQANGGLPVFGYPTSEEFMETSPTDGQQYLVQYFERNRFEHHPTNPDPYKVQLGLLGRQQLVERGWLR